MSTNPGDAGSATGATPSAAPAQQSVPSVTRTLGVEVGSAASDVKNYTDLKSPFEREVAQYEAELDNDSPDEVTPPAVDEAPANDEGKPDEDADEGDESEQSFDNPPENFDIDYYQGEFDAKGELSEASYKALEKQGFTKDVVDDYIEMRKEKAAALTKHWTDMMGGEDRKQAITEWARDTYSDKKKAAINKIMSGRDVDAIDVAVAAMVADYERANPNKPPQRQVGSGAPAAKPSGYANENDYRKDLRSESYRRDPAFRTQVQNRLRISAWYRAGKR